MLFGGGCLRCVDCRVLFVVCWLEYGVGCVMFVVCCVLCVVCDVVCVMCVLMYACVMIAR